MNEEAVKYAFDLFVRDGYKGDISKFQKLLATNQEALDYSFTLFERDGYKGGKDKYKVLMGLGETAAPVATAEPITTEPTKTEVVAEEPVKELSNKPLETVKVQGIPQREVEMPVADETKMPSMMVREVEPEVKEEPKKEMPIGENLLPVTEKTEVKAVETPSDKMVIKSEKTQSVPSETIQGKGLFASEDLKDIKLPKYKPEEIIDKKLLTENKESLGLKQFEDRDLIFKKWLESKGMPLNTKEESLNSEDISEYNRYQYNQESNLTRAIVDSYLPYLIENKDKLSSEYQEKLREELTSPTFKVFVQGFRRDFYNYDKNNPNFKLIEKVNEEYWRDPAIYSHVKSQYGIQDGEKQKMDANEFLQSPILKNSEKVITKFGPMFYDKENDTYYKYEYGILNAEPYVKYQLKNNPDYQAPLEIIKPGTEQHKLIKEGNKETWDGVYRTMYRGMSVKKDGNMQVKEVTEQPKMEVKEVTKEEPKMVIKSEKKGKDKVAPETIKIEPIKVETKGGQIQVEVPTFAIPEPKKKYKPYGEKGPDVYYSEDFDQFIIKEGNERTVAGKGSPKYAEIETKLAQAAGATKEGKGKCDTPPFIGCSPNKTALNEFLYFKDDVVTDGYRSTDEGGLIEQLDDRKRTIENRGESLWSIYNSKNPNEGVGDIYYANEEPPKSDRFVIYKPFGNDKTLIYDKESGAILKQLDGKAPKIDAIKESSPVYDTKGNIIKEQRNAKDTWRNYSKNNPNEGLTVWQGFEIDHPEYKELKSIIEGIDYKKAKGSKNTFIPTFNPVPETPEWQKQ